MVSIVGRLFKTKTESNQQETLASFVPNGRPFLAKRFPQATLYKLLWGLAIECGRAEGQLNDITLEHEIYQTTYLIDEWERALGIPDSCMPVADTLEKRRNNVLLKLGAMGLQTEQDWIDFLAILGYNATIRQGRCYGIFPYVCTFPLYLFDQPMSARFDWEITVVGPGDPCIFPFSGLFPICFSDGFTTVLGCFIRKLKPTNTNIRIIYT